MNVKDILKPRHIHCLRMLECNIYQDMQIETLFVYSSENQVLTIEDFIKINSNYYGYKLICCFYGGFYDFDDFFERNKIPFNLCLLSDNEISWINKPKTATHYSEIPKFPNGCEISFYVKRGDLWMMFVNSDSITVCDQRTIESLELKEINLPKWG